MIKFFKDLFTEDDGQTWCFARVSSGVGVITYTAMGITHVIQHDNISFNDFGIGFGALLAGCAAVIAGKAATQHDSK